MTKRTDAHQLVEDAFVRAISHVPLSRHAEWRLTSSVGSVRLELLTHDGPHGHPAGVVGCVSASPAGRHTYTLQPGSLPLSISNNQVRFEAEVRLRCEALKTALKRRQARLTG